jgi:hypothetical protein
MGSREDNKESAIKQVVCCLKRGPGFWEHGIGGCWQE